MEEVPHRNSSAGVITLSDDGFTAYRHLGVGTGGGTGLSGSVRGEGWGRVSLPSVGATHGGQKICSAHINRSWQIVLSRSVRSGDRITSARVEWQLVWGGCSAGDGLRFSFRELNLLSPDTRYTSRILIEAGKYTSAALVRVCDVFHVFWSCIIP